MATLQTDGTSPVTSQSSVNNGGTIRANGNVSSGVLSSVQTSRPDLGRFGSTVIDNNSADPALTSGAFAYNNDRPVAKKTTTSLAGVSNDVLLSAAGQPGLVRSIHRQEVVRTRRLATAIRLGRWNIFKGKFLNNQTQASQPPTVAVDPFWDNANNTTSVTSTDEAASPTRSVPGELVYRDGSALPVTDVYKPKTG